MKRTPKASDFLLGDEWNFKKKQPAFVSEILKMNQQTTSDKFVEQGILLFNERPKKGIDWCIQKKILLRDPARIVEFLLETKGLSKFAIGQYLADPDDFNQEVLKAYTS